MLKYNKNDYNYNQISLDPQTSTASVMWSERWSEDPI